jgi:hypothetical protein
VNGWFTCHPVACHPVTRNAHIDAKRSESIEHFLRGASGDVAPFYRMDSEIYRCILMKNRVNVYTGEYRLFSSRPSFFTS